MKFDVFFSICQTSVDGFIPSEKQMWLQFFEQVKWADSLGYEIAWVAETHLSCQAQKLNPGAVNPHFEGEIGINTDILQLAHQIFARTKRIHVGSAVKSLLTNGGPLAHAEALKTFASLHALDPNESRKLFYGFAAGRFPFSSEAYGIAPRNPFEKKHWNEIKPHVFRQATDMFLRGLKSDYFSSKECYSICLTPDDFSTMEAFQEAANGAKEEKGYELTPHQIFVPSFWTFPKVGVIPKEAPMDCVQLVMGSHDPKVQHLSNQYFPTWVFNLSITPEASIEATHGRMQKEGEFHPLGGTWKRDYMPRTVMIFLNNDPELSPQEQRLAAKLQATKAQENYWKAMEGTISETKVQQAVSNSIWGNAEDIVKAIKAKYHPLDRLMLWFDFNNHDQSRILRSMTQFWEHCRPHLLH